MSPMSSNLQHFTITFTNGTKHGGKFADEDAVHYAYAHCLDKIQRIEERPLWTPEEEAEVDRDKAWARAY